MGVLKKHSVELFGHTHVFTGYEKTVPYFRVSQSGAIDGIGREHLRVESHCDTCDKWVLIGMTHKNKEE